MTTEPTAFEPAIPTLPGAELDELRDLTRALAEKAEALAPGQTSELAERRRIENARASNAIERHYLTVAEVEAAVRGEPPLRPGTEALREEAVAHVEVEHGVNRRIEEARAGGAPFDPMALDFILWVHGEFYRRMPEKFRRMGDESIAPVQIMPGEVRDRMVAVGPHWCPEPAALPDLLAHFHQRYRLDRFNAIEDKLIAIAASHARFEWIHPFLDGNGRTGRLMLHAALAWVLPSGCWWPESAALERDREGYILRIARSCWRRANDMDGRGPLSERELRAWVKFVLENAIDETRRRSEGDFEISHRAAMARIDREIEMSDSDMDILIRGISKNGGHIPERLREQYGHFPGWVLDRVEAIVCESFGIGE